MKVTRVPPPEQPTYVRIEMTESAARALVEGLGNVSWRFFNGASLEELYNALRKEV